MLSKLKIIFCLFFFCCSFLIIAQDTKTIERLKQQISTGKDDTIKIDRLLQLTLCLVNYEFKNAVEYATEAHDLSVKLNYTKGRVKSFNSLADAYWYHSDYEKAQQYYFKAYRISDSIHDQRAVAFSLYNIGWIICVQQHNYNQSKYLYRSLEIFKQLKDSAGLLLSYNGISGLYIEKYIDEHLRKDFDSAIVYTNKGIEVAKKLKAYDDLANFYSNMADVFYDEKDYTSSIYYEKKSYEINQKKNDSASMTCNLLDIAKCDMETNRIAEAISKLNFVYQYNIRHHVKDIQMITLRALAKAYYLVKDYKRSSDFTEDYLVLKEEEEKQAYSTSISNLQSSYELEKSEINNEKLKQQNEIEELKNKKNKFFIFGLIAIAIGVISVAFLLFKKNKEKQLTNIQLKQQNHVITEKKQEIESSIQYAKGIQQAILPNSNDLNEQFPRSFILYKPKDVVSGDFYWFSKVDDGFYCVAADCTGHGVPGALMSIIGIEKIVQAVFEKKLSEPGAILSFLNTQIKQVLKQHSDASKQKDGMDLALLKFNTSLTEVEYAAANRPLLIVRNKEVTEYKADKTAIAGFTPDEQIFATTKISLQKNDSLFIFTDGYADQFGGDNGKKFMFKNMKDLLISVSELNAQQQKEKIEVAFNNWKGSHEQVDDVLIIGITI